MRTKTLLAAAALIAAGVASSMAQSNVYSLNIVGYYNVPITGALSDLANSLKAGPVGQVNRADHVIPYVDGDNLQIWNGASFDTITMDGLSGTGWGDAGGDVPLTSLPVLSQGKGFFYGRNNITTTNITFVGEVALGTNVVVINPGLNSLGSMLPLGGLVQTGPINLVFTDGDNLQKWNGASFDTTTRDGLSGTGWGDAGGDVPEPTLTVGQGFFYGRNNAGSFNWTQILTQ